MTWVPEPLWAAGPPAGEPPPPPQNAPETGEAAADPEAGDCAGETASETPETTPAAQAPAPEPTYAETLGRQPARIKCLDESLIDELGRTRARKGVQPRFFTKGGRVVIDAAGGAYGGDLVSTNWQAGGGLGVWFTEDFGIEGQFRVVPIDFRLERAATGFTGEDRYPDGGPGRYAYMVNAHLMWAPIHTKLKAGKERVIHGDFAFFGGAGKTFHDTVQGVSFDIGASFYLFPARFVSLRIDLADHILSQEVLGSRRIANNLMFSFGVGIWIPFRLKGKRPRGAQAEIEVEDEFAEDLEEPESTATGKKKRGRK